MGTKTEDQEDKTERTVGLYPSKSQKVVKPIDVKSNDSEDKIEPSEEHSEKEIKPESPKPAPAKAKSKTVKTKPATKIKSSLEIDEAEKSVKEESPSETPTKDSPVSDEDDSDSDDNAIQVPDTEAALNPEFIDEGQYHIIVPKKHKVSKKSSISVVLWVIFIIFLLAVAGYLYASVFGIELNDILDDIRKAVGL